MVALHMHQIQTRWVELSVKIFDRFDNDKTTTTLGWKPVQSWGIFLYRICTWSWSEQQSHSIGRNPYIVMHKWNPL